MLCWKIRSHSPFVVLLSLNVHRFCISIFQMKLETAFLWFRSSIVRLHLDWLNIEVRKWLDRALEYLFILGNLIFFPLSCKRAKKKKKQLYKFNWSIIILRFDTGTQTVLSWENILNHLQAQNEKIDNNFWELTRDPMSKKILDIDHIHTNRVVIYILNFILLNTIHHVCFQTKLFKSILSLWRRIFGKCGMKECT